MASREPNAPPDRKRAMPAAVGLSVASAQIEMMVTTRAAEPLAIETGSDKRGYPPAGDPNSEPFGHVMAQKADNQLKNDESRHERDDDAPPENMAAPKIVPATLVAIGPGNAKGHGTPSLVS
jgi:hypothetical protein